MDLVLAGIAVVIIISLAFYAGLLINRINTNKAREAKQQEMHEQIKQQKIEERNASIVESIRFIAKATMQKQCNVSEAAIRLTVLLETLQLKQPIDLATAYPALTAMYEKVKDMPTHDERKKRPVKEIKILDVRRELFEAEMEEAIIKESTMLAEFNLS